MANKLLRVTQMNAIYLDKEIYRTFLQLIHDCYKYLPPGFTAPYDPEINLLVRLAIVSGSVLKDSSTFGQQLLSIKYNDMSTFKKLLYLFASSSDYIEHRFVFSARYPTLYALIKLLDFLNMSIFLRNGSKPLLIERLLGLNQAYATEGAARHFESKYLARELLWNGFIEIFVNVLPLINYHKLSRTARKYNPFHKKSSYNVIDRQKMTPLTKCAHCSESPVYPHHMGCEHIFCYVCLKVNNCREQGNVAGTVFCDLHEAFHCVSNDILIRRQSAYNFSSDTAKLVQSYLTNRKQLMTNGVIDSDVESVLMELARGNQTADPKYECPVCEHSNSTVLCKKVILV